MIEKFKQPSGVKDSLPTECIAKKKTEEILLAKFASYGCRQIDTPVLEYGEMYAGAGRYELRRLFKLTDTDGNLLVLRPDMTMPISRIVATKFEPGSYKLCYLGKTFRLAPRSGLREFTQAGVEYMGCPGTAFEAEAVALAIEALRACGLDGFIIDIGHVGFFGGILDLLGLDPKKRDELAALAERKDVIGESLFAAREGLDPEIMKLLSRLPMLFGDGKVLDEAERLCMNDAMRRSVSELKALDAALVAAGYGDRISYDLSLVGEMSYYSGLVFKGLCEGAGSPVLSGGRYDRLCDAFGRRVPSVGFAVGVDVLTEALGSAGSDDIRVYAAVGCDGDARSVGAALALAAKLSSEGRTVELLGECEEESVASAAAERRIYYRRGEEIRL